jgi:hypothetical protein
VLNVSPSLQAKTIVFSGFAENLSEKIPPEEYAQLNIIDKNDTEQLRKIISYLEEFGVQKG